MTVDARRPAGPRRTPLALAGAALLLAGVTALWFVAGHEREGHEREGHGDERASEADRSADPSTRAPRSSGDRSNDPTILEPTADERPGDAERVSGVVISDAIGPLSEGRLALWCPGGQQRAILRLDETGSFEGPACEDQQPTCARLIHPVATQPEPWLLEPGKPQSLFVALAPQLAGTIRWASGDPTADAQIILRSGEAVRSGHSDADGAFTLALPRLRPCDPCDPPSSQPRCADDRAQAQTPPAIATVLVQAAGAAPLQRDVILAGDLDTVQEFTLEPPLPAVEGTVVDAIGLPFDGRTRVLARSRARQDEAHSAAVDEQGRFRLDALGPGDYDLRALRDGLALATGEAHAGEVVRLESTRTASGPQLSLQVLDADGRPRVDVRVDGGPFRGDLTDETGAVLAERVVPGTYALRLSVDGCPARRDEITVTAPGAPTQTVTVTVTDCAP